MIHTCITSIQSFFLLHTDTQSMNGLQMFFALQQIFNVQFD